MTMGAMPTTRRSPDAPTIQVVQPRLLAPHTTNRLIGLSVFAVADCTASIAPIAAFAIANSKGHEASPVSRYFWKV